MYAGFAKRVKEGPNIKPYEAIPPKLLSRQLIEMTGLRSTGHFLKGCLGW